MYRFFYSICTLALLCAGCKTDNNTKDTTSVQHPAPVTDNSTPESDKTAEILIPSDPFLRKYKGTIGEENITMLLINWGNGLVDGYYQTAKHTQKIELLGEVNLDENIHIIAYNGEEEAGFLHTSFSDPAQLSGQWFNADSSRQLPFSAVVESEKTDQHNWTGKYHFEDAHGGGMLLIGNVTLNTFYFALSISTGGHNGEVKGIAQTNGNQAVFTKDFELLDETCQLQFIRECRIY